VCVSNFTLEELSGEARHFDHSITLLIALSLTHSLKLSLSLTHTNMETES